MRTSLNWLALSPFILVLSGASSSPSFPLRPLLPAAVGLHGAFSNLPLAPPRPRFLRVVLFGLLGSRVLALGALQVFPLPLVQALALLGGRRRAARRSPMSPATREQLFGGLPFTKLMQQMQRGRGGSSGRLTSPDLKALNSLIHSRTRSTSMRDYSSYCAYSDYLDR